MTDFEFPKNQRLRKRKEFTGLSKHGYRVQNSEFIIVFYSNDLKTSRIGITATRKIGNAVVRNRCKRLVRECFRRNRARIKGNVDINVIVKKGAAGLPGKHLFSSLISLFEKISDKIRTSGKQRNPHIPVL